MRCLIALMLLCCLALPVAAGAEYPANAFSPIPAGYLNNSPAESRIERVTYKAYTEHGIEYIKNALVYVPAGYDDAPDTRYDILYLMHGGGGNETDFLGGETLEKQLKHLMDNMIATGAVAPMLVCTPCYRIPYCDETKSTQKFPGELREALLPAVESKYRTHALTADEAGFRASRDHRAFGGFSMGGASTWCVFETCMDYFANFLPISGDCWSVSGSAAVKAAYLARRVEEQGFTASDFRIYAGCGNKSDVAYGNLTPQIEAMKQQEMFIWGETFEEGNLYYAINSANGHELRTVLQMVYNALPKFFQQ